MKIDPGPWKYFGLDSPTGEGVYEIYRLPANGKPLYRQELEEVYVLKEDGSWLSNQRESLLGEWNKGWFSLTEDEITEEEAIKYYNEWTKKKGAWPGGKRTIKTK